MLEIQELCKRNKSVGLANTWSVFGVGVGTFYFFSGNETKALDCFEDFIQSVRVLYSLSFRSLCEPTTR